MESTRKAVIGSSNLEIHLKKNIEVTQEVAAQINQLPTSDPWVLLRYDTEQNQWRNAQTFKTFEEADEQFVTLTQNNGLQDVSRLQISSGGRVIREG